MNQEISSVKAVHEWDLDKLLERFGVKEDFEKGKFKCKFNQTVVTKDNLYSIIPESGRVNFVCNDPESVLAFHQYLEEKQKAKVKK